MLCSTAKIVQEHLEEQDKEFKVVAWPPYVSDLNSICVTCWIKKSPIHGGPTSQLTGLKGSANVLVSDITARLWRSCGVNTLMGQSCFGDIRGTYTRLGR